MVPAAADVQILDAIPLNNLKYLHWLLTRLPLDNGRHIADDIFKRIFMNEMFCILIKISRHFQMHFLEWKCLNSN